MSKINFDIIIKWGQGKDFGSEPLKIDKGVTIIDRNKFYKAHVSVIEAGRKRENKSIIMPYCLRLLRFYELLNTKVKNTKL